MYILLAYSNVCGKIAISHSVCMSCIFKIKSCKPCKTVCAIRSPVAFFCHIKNNHCYTIAEEYIGQKHFCERKILAYMLWYNVLVCLTMNPFI